MKPKQLCTLYLDKSYLVQHVYPGCPPHRQPSLLALASQLTSSAPLLCMRGAARYETACMCVCICMYACRVTATVHLHIHSILHSHAYTDNNPPINTTTVNHYLLNLAQTKHVRVIIFFLSGITAYYQHWRGKLITVYFFSLIHISLKIVTVCRVSQFTARTLSPSLQIS